MSKKPVGLKTFYLNYLNNNVFFYGAVEDCGGNKAKHTTLRNQPKMLLMSLYNFLFQTLAITHFASIDVRIGTFQIPNGTNPVTLNNRCQYLPVGSKDYSEVIFDCGGQGILGNIISLQNKYTNISFLEVEFLGNFLYGINQKYIILFQNP